MGIHIKCILDKFLEKGEEKKKYREKIRAAVGRLLGEKERTHISFSSVEEKKIILCFDSSSAIYEFNLKKKDVLEKIKKEFPEIKDIKSKLN